MLFFQKVNLQTTVQSLQPTIEYNTNLINRHCDEFEEQLEIFNCNKKNPQPAVQNCLEWLRVLTILNEASSRLSQIMIGVFILGLVGLAGIITGVYVITHHSSFSCIWGYCAAFSLLIGIVMFVFSIFSTINSFCKKTLYNKAYETAKDKHESTTPEFIRTNFFINAYLRDTSVKVNQDVTKLIHKFSKSIGWHPPDLSRSCNSSLIKSTGYLSLANP